MKENNVAIQFRMKESTHLKLKAIATAELRSLNSQIEYYALKGIQEYEKENGKIKIDKNSSPKKDESNP